LGTEKLTSEAIAHISKKKLQGPPPPPVQ
jgi:hypothetical protein